MTVPLLETKLHAPERRRGWVARPRLVARLNRATASALTLVSAPAGFGKTTLLADWLAGAAAEEWSAAWLSLDERDNDPMTFWTYLVAALRTAGIDVGAGALTLLQSSRSPVEALVTTLLNDLSAVAHDVVLVLDDFHLLDDPDVRAGTAFLLDHLPPRMHLVIAGRADPTLSLARLRGRGELVEIRAADLRFTPDEAGAYLNGAMGLALPARDVAALEERTEGWISALQLAALSLEGRDDTAAFVAGFAGDDRYIVDYLAEEVLARQPEAVRLFLLQTSVLDRLNGPLCDAVTGRPGGAAQLVELERRNLFLVPLDRLRRWYRYHRLFADVLQARLRDERLDEVATLYRRASTWFEENGDPAEAIRHALAAGDTERAADLIEPAVPAMSRDRREVAALGWLRELPDAVVRTRPVLAVALAGALLAVGELDGVEQRLEEAERRLGTPGAERIVHDDAEFRRLPAMIALYRAALALTRGDLVDTVRCARRALDLSPADDHRARASAAGLSGLASWTGGDLDAGHRAYAACMAGLRRAGFLADTFGCAIAMADIRIAQGLIDEAMRTYEQALQHAPGDLRGTADMHVGMSELHLERDDLPAAERHLRRADELGDDLGLPQNPYRKRVAAARLCEARGDPGGALDLLDDAERVYVGDFFPDVRPVAAVRARMWVAHGRAQEALAWVRERGLSAEDELGYLREFEHITLARVLLARASVGEATGLLERLLGAAQVGARTGSVVEILVLLALAYATGGDAAGARATLRRAVALAEPESYVRVFVNEGPALAPLLRSVAKEWPTPYVRRLLAGVDDRPSAGPGLVDPLSERELEVLRLLGTDLDGPDIARRLVVSLNTLRTHTSHIYAKLGVNNRRAAVRRAAELHLTSTERHR